MKLEIHKKEKLVATAWSGGTTTQLFIYPYDAEYSKRNFDFRISTATVEAEESVFTSLPGITRKLMILEGSLIVTHRHHYTKKLEKFEQDEFDGGWETTSVGKVRDFNVMTTGSRNARVEACVLKDGEEMKCEHNNLNFTGLYFYKGLAEIKSKDGVIQIGEGDFVSFEKESANDLIMIKAKTPCEIIRTDI